jgi:hypothetical protein
MDTAYILFNDDVIRHFYLKLAVIRLHLQALRGLRDGHSCSSPAFGRSFEDTEEIVREGLHFMSSLKLCPACTEVSLPCHS